MRLMVFASLLSSLAVVGCAARKAAPPPPATMPAQEIDTTSLRASLMRRPDVAAVGVVTLLLPDMPWADIGEINTQDIRVGDIFTIVDGQSPIANATVASIFKDGVHVRYETIAGRRAPLVGDLAIKFKNQS